MQKVKKIWNTVTTVLVSLVVVLALLLVGVQLFGVKVYTVLSGSMEPQYLTGSVIYVVEVDPAELEVNDPITFRLSPKTTATHRIVEIRQENGQTQYITKGDNNEHRDKGFVTAEDIIGKPVFSIPLLGYVITYIQQPPGSYVAISAGAFLFLLLVLPDVLFDEKKTISKKEGYEHEEDN